MEVFRKRHAEVKRAEDARNNLLNDLIQALDDVQKTIDSNSFDLILINGDSLQFLDHLVRQGIHGGDEAAKLLRKAVFEYLRHDQDYKRNQKIVIKIYSNLRGLSRSYAEKAILPNSTAFSDFVSGFNKAHPLCDFVDAGNHKEAADTKLKETLDLYISNVHCKQIIFGAPTGNTYPSFLNSYVDVDVPARIRLLKGPPFSRDFQNILHKFQWTEFKDVFRDNLLSDDDTQTARQGSNTSLLDKTIPETVYAPSLLPWKLNSKTETQTGSKGKRFTVSNSHSTSPNGSEVHQTTHDDAVFESKQNIRLVQRSNNSPEDRDVVSALVSTTKENLKRAPRSLDFGSVKTQVEQTLGLRTNFWGTSTGDEWSSRSKNVIKWAVEEWILETNNPPPKNATWMLRYFSEGQPPSTVVKSAPWRTKADRDWLPSRLGGTSPLASASPIERQANRLSELIMTSPVLRNAAGQRIDVPLNLRADERLIAKVRKRNPRLCNAHHLRRACLNRNCEYDHDTRLAEDEFEALLYLSRSQPCPSGPTCNNPNCTRGHACPSGKLCTFGDRCRFPGTHIIDTKPVQEEQDLVQEEQPQEPDFEYTPGWSNGSHADWNTNEHTHNEAVSW